MGETVANLDFLTTSFSGLKGGAEAVKKCMKVKEEAESLDDYYYYDYDYYFDDYDYMEEGEGMEVRRKREAGRVKIQRPGAKRKARGIRRRKTRIRKVKEMATKEKTNPEEVGKEATKIQTANPITKRKERGKTARIAGKRQIKTESLSTKIQTKPHQKKMRRR